ncbi:MAG: alpha/beta hydrolase, partial [Sphingomonas sp.]
MPEVIFPGPDGRLEGRFAPPPRPRAPVAMILHPHPNAGGTMNNRMVQELYKTFQRRGFATLRFNFRGVGKSQGVFDNGVGELSDAASALDWVQSIHPEAQTTWIAGVSFGAWIG